MLSSRLQSAPSLVGGLYDLFVEIKLLIFGSCTIAESHTNYIKKGAHIAEVTVGLKGGMVVHASEHSDNMLTSIDQVAHKLAHLLQKHHGKVTKKSHKSRKSLARTISADEEDVAADPDVEEMAATVEQELIHLNDEYREAKQVRVSTVRSDAQRCTSCRTLLHSSHQAHADESHRCYAERCSRCRPSPWTKPSLLWS
jgi:ribosome-associated translation inhibitor RaiA/ubiquitin